MSNHYVNKLMKNSLSCFCCFCRDSNFATCENVLKTKEWDADVLIHNDVILYKVPWK